MADSEYDIAVIGAGIAGASVAVELAARCRVVLLEQESAPGYHTTGRSAALFSKVYGPAPIRALSRASEAFFTASDTGFAAAPLLTPRGTLFPARADQGDALEAMRQELSTAPDVRAVTPAQMVDLCPLLRPDYAVAGLWDDAARDIDVDALHGGFLRQFKQRGGTLICRAPVTAMVRDGAGWDITAGGQQMRAATAVNAAGAWADEIGALAGAAPIGLVPKRRSAAIVAAPDGFDPSGMRMIVDIEEQFYLKPEAGKLLISPADETPSAPCDAQPEEIDIAICVDRIETAFDLSVRRIEHKWAGLRSFVADKCPVAGYDPDLPGFFWLAGQGGYGIQTSPALAQVAASLVMGDPVPDQIASHGVDPADMAPARIRHAA